MQRKLLCLSSIIGCLIAGSAGALVLDISTRYGGSGNENFATDVATDAAGRIYVVGQTNSGDAPTTNAFQSVYGGERDGFVFCFDPATSNLVYATYLGGSAEDLPTAVIVADDGNLFVAGFTRSDNFPAVNAFQPTRRGGAEGFITQLDPNGQPVFSTFLGGGNADEIFDMARDTNGNLYVVGFTESGGFPTTGGAFQEDIAGFMDAFVAKITVGGGGLDYATFLGGGQNDLAYGIDVASDGSAIVTGETFSDNFPTNKSFQSTRFAEHSAFVTKLDPTGSELINSSYFGRESGSSNAVNVGIGVVVDASNNVFVVGGTTSPDLASTNAFDNTHNGETDIFLLRLDSTGTNLTLATFLGGKGIDFVEDVALTTNGQVLVTGGTDSTDFPVKDLVQAKFGGGSDIFLTLFDPTSSNIVFSSFLGGKSDDDAFGMFVDADNRIYLAGFSKSSNFPLVNSIPNVPASSQAAIVARILSIAGHDLAITKMKAPKKVTLQTGKPPKVSKIKVDLINLGPHSESITSLAMLSNLVQITIQSLGGCAVPQATIAAPGFPVNWASGGKLSVTFAVTFDCANHGAQGTGSEDYQITATVDHAALDGNADTSPASDVCPRGPIGTDKGCGNKDPVTKTLGAPVLVDVVVKP